MPAKPRPIPERPSLEVNQQYEFDADARLVRDYILGGPDVRSRIIQGREGDIYFIAELIEADSPYALYFFELLIHATTEPWGDPETYRGLMHRMGVRAGGVAIGLVQLRSGETRATLYFDLFDARWFQLAECTMANLQGASRFAGRWWKDLIEGWQRRQPSRDAVRSERQGGRPRDPESDWAFEQVHVLGREPKDVFAEWLARRGSRGELMVDPLDSFKKAIRARRRGRKGEQRE